VSLQRKAVLPEIRWARFASKGSFRGQEVCPVTGTLPSLQEQDHGGQSIDAIHIILEPHGPADSGSPQYTLRFLFYQVGTRSDQPEQEENLFFLGPHFSLGRLLVAIPQNIRRGLNHLSF